MEEINRIAFDWQFSSVVEIFEGFKNLEENFFQIPLLGEDKINPEKLRQILISHIDMVDRVVFLGTNLIRLFRIYDYLAIGPRYYTRSCSFEKT